MPNLGSILPKLLAFIRKDYQVESSYKMAFTLSIISSFLPLIAFYFIGQLMSQNAVDSLEKYGGDYFAFALVGLSFSRYFQLAISTFSNSIRRAQMAGCLEAILSSRTDPREMIIYSSVYSFLASGIQLVLMFFIGWLFLDFSFASINILSTGVALFLSLITFVSLGIFSAAGTIVFKKGEPFAWFFGAFSALFGGVYFPVSIMPDWLEQISVVVPIHYALEALRMTILQGSSITAISHQLLVLAFMAVCLFPLSVWMFVWAVEKGKKDGSLMHY